MGFSIPIARLKNEDIDSTLSEARAGSRYEGPTPPPGVYNAKIKKVWYKETRTGKPALNVLFVIDEQNENKVYNGAGIFNMYLIPADPTSPAFSIQMSQLDSFVMALSNGTMGYKGFQEAAHGEKIILKEPQKYDPSKNNEIKQIGKLVVTGEQTANIKAKMETYDGKERASVHYLVDVPTASKAEASATEFAEPDGAFTEATPEDNPESDEFDAWMSIND